jgi:hypothetical protein
MSAGPLRIELHAQPDTAIRGDVLLIDDSGVAVRVWKPGNSWGDAPLSFELVGDGASTPIVRKPRRYTRNPPAWRQLQPGEALRIPYDLDDGSWETGGALDEPARGDALMAVYDVPQTPEAIEHGVWIGCVRSDPLPMT